LPFGLAETPELLFVALGLWVLQLESGCNAEFDGLLLRVFSRTLPPLPPPPPAPAPVPGVDGFGAVGFIGKSDWPDCCLTNPLESGLADSAVSVNLILSLSLFVLLMLRPLLDGLFPGGDADNGLPPSAPPT
jgi:hypothetical protein